MWWFWGSSSSSEEIDIMSSATDIGEATLLSPARTAFRVAVDTDVNSISSMSISSTVFIILLLNYYKY